MTIAGYVPVLPMELDEQVAMMLAKHTPFTFNEIIYCIRDTESVDLTLCSIHYACTRNLPLFVAAIDTKIIRDLADGAEAAQKSEVSGIKRFFKWVKKVVTKENQKES